MPPKPLDFLQTAAPDATNVHNNIDDLIYQSDAENLWQKALNKVEQGMSGYKHPQPITGTAPDVALNPLLAARKIPSLMRLLKKVKLKNPIYHHTNIPKAREILHSKEIQRTSLLDEDVQTWGDKWKNMGAFSVTRDPRFLSRPHSNIGTDVRFIMDRDDLIKKGYKIKPVAVKGFRKTEGSGNVKALEGFYNPRFEFEERVFNTLPSKDIKLIDWAKIPVNKIQDAYWDKKFPLRPTDDLSEFIHRVMNVDKGRFGFNAPYTKNAPTLPLMMSNQVRSSLEKLAPFLMNKYTWAAKEGFPQYLKSWKKLMSAPTYKYNPFKLRKGVDKYNNPIPHQEYLKKETGP